MQDRRIDVIAAARSVTLDRTIASPADARRDGAPSAWRSTVVAPPATAQMGAGNPLICFVAINPRGGIASHQPLCIAAPWLLHKCGETRTLRRRRDRAQETGRGGTRGPSQ